MLWMLNSLDPGWWPVSFCICCPRYINQADPTKEHPQPGGGDPRRKHITNIAEDNRQAIPFGGLNSDLFVSHLGAEILQRISLGYNIS